MVAGADNGSAGVSKPPRRRRFARLFLWLGAAISIARVGALWYAFALVTKYDLPESVSLPQWLWYPEALLLPDSFAWTLPWTAIFSGCLLAGSFAIAFLLAVIDMAGFGGAEA